MVVVVIVVVVVIAVVVVFFFSLTRSPLRRPGSADYTIFIVASYSYARLYCVVSTNLCTICSHLADAVCRFTPKLTATCHHPPQSPLNFSNVRVTASNLISLLTHKLGGQPMSTGISAAFAMRPPMILAPTTSNITGWLWEQQDCSLSKLWRRCHDVTENDATEGSLITIQKRHNMTLFWLDRKPYDLWRRRISLDHFGSLIRSICWLIKPRRAWWRPNSIIYIYLPVDSVTCKRKLAGFVLRQTVIRSWLGFRAKHNNIMFLRVPTYSGNATISSRTLHSMQIRELKPTQSPQTQFKFSSPKVFDFFIQTWTISFHLTSAGPLLCTWSQLQQPGGKELGSSHGFLPENPPC